MIANNPFVDAIWEVQQTDHNQTAEVWTAFEREARRRKEIGEFDKIFFTQIPPNNFENYDGTSRSSLFRGYPHPIRVPVQPVVRLAQTEVGAVSKFVATHGLGPSDIIILMEAASSSGQSFVTPEYALRAAEIALRADHDLKFILSSDKKIESRNHNIIDGSALTLRENAELTKYCTLLVGSSSAISWIATSDWAKPLPQIQLLRKNTRMYASMLQDAKYFGLPTENILEVVDVSPQETADMIISVVALGFAQTRSLYQRNIPLKFDFYLSQIYHELLKKRQYQKAAQAISCAFQRYSYDVAGRHELARAFQHILTPYLHLMWNRLTESERAAFVALGYKTTRNALAGGKWRSFLQLCIFALGGTNYRIARLLVLNVINEHLGMNS